MELPKIEKLSELLVTPERFGKLALAPIVQLRLPETARIYGFPSQEGEGV